MRILVDADACPVVDIVVRLATRYGLDCLLFCDTAHRFERPGAETIVVSTGADSVDLALVNRLRTGDLVVTQDYGLAALALARGGRPLTQNGLVIDDGNLDALLAQRHMAAKLRRAGGRLKGPSKRTTEQDRAFEAALIKCIEKGVAHHAVDPVSSL